MNVSGKDKREAYSALARVIHAVQQLQLDPSIVRCAMGGVLNAGKLKAAKTLLEDAGIALGDAVISSDDQLARRNSTPNGVEWSRLGRKVKP